MTNMHANPVANPIVSGPGLSALWSFRVAAPDQVAASEDVRRAAWDFALGVLSPEQVRDAVFLSVVSAGTETVLKSRDGRVS